MRFIKVLLITVGIITVFGLANLVWPQSLVAVPAKEPGRVIMVIIDRVSLADLSGPDLPAFQHLASIGAVGLMNTNTGGGRTSENAYITIGGGAHLIATGVGGQAFKESEKVGIERASDEFKNRTGWEAPVGSVVHLGIARLLQMNEDLPYSVQLGALGTALHAAGLKTAVLGNTDLEGSPGREVALIAMDKRGLVDAGKVGTEILTTDTSFLGGRRTDYQKLLKAFLELKEKNNFIAIELGDTSRLDKSSGEVREQVLEASKRLALEKADLFLGSLLREINLKKDLLLLVVPTPGIKAIKENEMLTPVIAAGPGIKPGLLTSSTTRRLGIVMNTDLAPTLLEYFGLSIPPEVSGRSLQSVPEKNGLELLKELNRRVLLTYTARPPFQKGYIIYQLALLFTSLYFIFWKKHKKGKILKPFLLSVMAVPLAYLLLPLFPQQSLPQLLGILLILTVLTTAAAMVLDNCWYLAPFIFLCFTNAGFLIFDTLAGSVLQKYSIMSYDPMLGARFYGMGNEYMGILIGSTIIGITALITMLPARRNIILIFTAFFFIFVTYVIAAPNLGANFGGTVAALTGYLITFLLLLRVKFTRGLVLKVITGAVLVLFFFILIDLRRPPDEQSHIGQAARMILSKGITELLNIASRKVEVNIRLVKYTIWSRIFLASLGTLALLFYRPVGVMQSIRTKYPDLFYGFVGVVAASIVAFIFNDSGVVAAATTMIFGAPPLTYLIIQELGHKG